MLNILFLWEWDRAKEIEPNWRDGLRACLYELDKKNKVDWSLGEPPKKDYDWIITWCDSNSQYSHFFAPQYKAKRGIFLTTNPTNYHNLQGFDVVFCESSVVLEECRRWGIHAVKAFGTDTEFFKPKKIKKDIEYFYPATFSPWKRQASIAYLGPKLTCIGTIQPDGMGEYGACIERGVKCEVGYFPPEKIRDYYNRTQRIIIPAVHGSERTVLEAMSMNILPEVIHEANEKAQSYLQEYARSDCRTPSEFVKKYYSAKTYAKSVLKGLNECD